MYVTHEELYAFCQVILGVATFVLALVVYINEKK